LKQKFAVVALMLSASCLFGALTEEQRVQDFQALSGLYAKSYAGANWKIVSLGVNLFETKPWIARVRAAKSDLEHVQVLMEYVASFQDSHAQVRMQSNFLADLGFYCDLYDGKVMIDLVDRFLLPQRTYPFGSGDELISIDGRAPLELARQIALLSGSGNPRAGLRLALQRLTFRTQEVNPFAADVPDESTVVILRQSGATETYKIKWDKVGFPIRNLGAASTPGALSSGIQLRAVEESEIEEPTDRPAWRELFYKSRRAKLAGNRLFSRAEDEGADKPLRAVLGRGETAPVWTLPAGFQRRLGRSPNDVFFSGTYVSEGQRIGYLRLRDFDFSSNAQLNQLASEIVFFNANTDGLVLDVMRNPGGFVCSVMNAVSMVVPGGYRQIGFSIRPSLAQIRLYDEILVESEFFGDPQYFIDTFRFQRDLLISAFNNGRSMTGSIPLCGLDFPLRSQSFAYSKPVITLMDDFSASGGDLFPAMMQDNKRGKLVGVRTNGAGATIIETPGGPWSETTSSLTEGLMVRLSERSYPPFPTSPFLENVGVRPDVELDYMTVDNLRNGGRTFVAEFTKVIVNEILASKR
jgi:hypothetical protein